MHKLVVLQDPVKTAALMQRLDEAGIGATSTQEQSPANLYLGGAISSAIWVELEQDLRHASEILREVQSRCVSASCPRCGYSLRGHAGLSACPECAFVITASQADRMCARCRESVPATFEICWNCGAALESTETPVRDQVERPRRPPPDHA